MTEGTGWTMSVPQNMKCRKRNRTGVEASGSLTKPPTDAKIMQ